MPEAVGWVGVVMAVVSLFGSALSNVNARRAARDKMEFELKTKELEFQHEANRSLIDAQQEEIKTLRADIAECVEDRQRLRADMTESVEDRKRLRADMTELRATVKQLKASNASLETQLAEFQRINALPPRGQ